MIGSAKSSGPLVDIDIPTDGRLVDGVVIAGETSLVHVWEHHGGEPLFTRYLSNGYSISIAPNSRLIAVTDRTGFHIYAISLCRGQLKIKTSPGDDE